MTLGVQLCKFGLPRVTPWGGAEHRWLIWHVIPGSRREGLGRNRKGGKANAKVHYRGHCCEQLGFSCIRIADAKEYRLPPRRAHLEDGRAVYLSFQSHELKFGPRGTYFSKILLQLEGTWARWGKTQVESSKWDFRPSHPQWYALCGTSFPAEAKISEIWRASLGAPEGFLHQPGALLQHLLLIRSSEVVNHTRTSLPLWEAIMPGWPWRIMPLTSSALHTLQLVFRALSLLVLPHLLCYLSSAWQLCVPESFPGSLGEVSCPSYVHPGNTGWLVCAVDHILHTQTHVYPFSASVLWGQETCSYRFINTENKRFSLLLFSY